MRNKKLTVYCILMSLLFTDKIIDCIIIIYIISIMMSQRDIPILLHINKNSVTLYISVALCALDEYNFTKECEKKKNYAHF